MAVKISNTLSDYHEQSMILQKNYLETLSKINDATSSDKDYITLNITDVNDPNVIHAYQIPSFGYLKKSIDRLDKTMRNFMNISGKSNSKIRLEDGTYKIVTATIPSDPKPIEQLKPISNFGIKSNWFFEDLLNPCLFVSLDLTDQVDVDTQKVIVQRFIITCNTDLEKQEFKELYAGKSDIDYDTFISKFQHNMIYDEDIRQLQPRYKQFSGVFTIKNSEKPTYDYEGNIRKIYTLDTDEYVDNFTGLSRKLVMGDILETCDPDYNVTARYEIVEIEGKKVVLELKEGIAGLLTGTKLKIKSSVNDNVILDIPVGYNEREVVFVKPIDPISNIPAGKWSKGVGFITNNLTTDMFSYPNGDDMRLQDFYKKHVIDFGQVILSYAKDYYPSIREAIKPNVPNLIPSNFKVFCTNEHLIDNTTKTELLRLIDRKNKLSEDTPIKNIEGYKQILEDIDNITRHLVNYSPTFSVKGMWEVPEPKRSNSSDNQEVVGFKMKYRYISKDDVKTETKSIPLTTENGLNISVNLSDWNEVRLKTRERIQDKNGEYIWADVDIEDSDTVKFNECNIPIHPGERVEIQIKSLSEAGWPANPIESDWSNSLIVDFDDSLLSYLDIQSVINQNRVDIAVLKLIGK